MDACCVLTMPQSLSWIRIVVDATRTSNMLRTRFEHTLNALRTCLNTLHCDRSSSATAAFFSGLVLMPRILMPRCPPSMRFGQSLDAWLNDQRFGNELREDDRCALQLATGRVLVRRPANVQSTRIAQPVRTLRRSLKMHSRIWCVKCIRIASDHPETVNEFIQNVIYHGELRLLDCMICRLV